MRINTKPHIKKLLNRPYTIVTLIVMILLVLLIVLSINHKYNSGFIFTSQQVTFATDEEKSLVENYIKNNIVRLTPENASSKGAWVLTDISFSSTTRTGVFTYTDGIKFGQAEFRFSKSKDNLLAIGVKKRM